jgi:hypothetical protein
MRSPAQVPRWRWRLWIVEEIIQQLALKPS